MTSVFTDWKLDDETFDLLDRSWDVKKAKQILLEKPRQSIHVDIDPARALVAFVTVHDIDPYTIDLEIPLIMVSYKLLGQMQYFPIDGYHRLQKAFDLGLMTLPCVLLDIEETLSCEIKTG